MNQPPSDYLNSFAFFATLTVTTTVMLFTAGCNTLFSGFGSRLRNITFDCQEHGKHLWSNFEKWEKNKEKVRLVYKDRYRLRFLPVLAFLCAGVQIYFLLTMTPRHSLIGLNLILGAGLHAYRGMIDNHLKAVGV